MVAYYNYGYNHDDESSSWKNFENLDKIIGIMFFWNNIYIYIAFAIAVTIACSTVYKSSVVSTNTSYLRLESIIQKPSPMMKQHKQYSPRRFSDNIQRNVDRGLNIINMLSGQHISAVVEKSSQSLQVGSYQPPPITKTTTTTTAAGNGNDNDNDNTDNTSTNDNTDTATGEEVDAFLPEEHPIFDSKKEEHMMTGKQYTSSELPLKPPFYIIQMGTARSGSTFQVTLLNTIVKLKTQQWYDALGESPPKISLTLKTPPPPKGTQGPFVVKTHAIGNTWMNDLKERFGITTRVFTSSILNHTHVNTALHHQALPNMYNCSLCEVDSYVPIFGLSQEDVKLLKEYMRYYEIMRQCCGFQQSIYNRYRLHGCNVTQLLIDQPDIHYPHCEQHDLPKLEKEFDALPLTHSHFKDNYRWKKPGDCAHFDKEIIPGRDFNGHKFVSCALTLNKINSF